MDILKFMEGLDLSHLMLENLNTILLQTIQNFHTENSNAATWHSAHQKFYSIHNTVHMVVCDTIMTTLV